MGVSSEIWARGMRDELLSDSMSPMNPTNSAMKLLYPSGLILVC